MDYSYYDRLLFLLRAFFIFSRCFSFAISALERGREEVDLSRDPSDLSEAMDTGAAGTLCTVLRGPFLATGRLFVRSVRTRLVESRGPRLECRVMPECWES